MILSGVRGSDLPVIFIRLIELFTISLPALNYFFNYAILPVRQAQSELSDTIIILIIFLAALAPSVLTLWTRLGHPTSHLEEAATIIWMAVAASAFVHIELHHDKWIYGAYLLTLVLSATHSLSKCVNFREGTFPDFPSICLGYGILMLAPVIHASLRSSTSQQAMIPSYLIYIGLNALGGLVYIFRMPDRLGVLNGSKWILHGCNALATMYLSNTLFATLVADRLGL
ncbi:uncharacterized protein BO97DRAFT_449884 [Aspergillus homomorphus CBS 101889]|uniref:Uncharacterized protein n=1 Tax=Aspergillus homomorphus (strain CBS 101889) TaxID=1450537 RepID=A0A395HG87_ASPHC|nr:hypothetical protein BO97DRAFT_449884 [Aspergillus homomorphus CBS 101889]RAL06483.1 hypothetical protein BO97DRAFT_449884 [Aspergillus homomorphus CBS 101889]